jgi:hypothetical protein
MPSVREWLASLGLAEYADRFAEHRIDFEILRDLTDEDLKEGIGVVRLGDRRRLLRAIAELAGGASTTPKLAPGSESSPREEAERRHIANARKWISFLETQLAQPLECINESASPPVDSLSSASGGRRF